MSSQEYFIKPTMPPMLSEEQGLFWSKGYNYITLVTKIIVKVIINNVRTEISQLYVITFAIWV